MTLRKWTTLILIALTIGHSSMSLAQQSQQSGKSFKRGVATILFSTLGGAVLGLSTLSFYGDPEEHTENISTGALLGLLAGSGYLVYDSSRPPQGSYDISQSFEDQMKNKRALANAKAPVVISYQFDF